jgi:hypothetical protein
MNKVRVALGMCAALGWMASVAFAQRGAGDPSGVARTGSQPEIVSLSGTVLEVKTEPCGNTTGRSTVGTHFLMKTAQGVTLNIHLGPAAMVESVAKELAADQAVQVRAFRTEKMPEGHYVAQQLSYNGRHTTLRDRSLQPVWASGAGRGAAGGAAHTGAARGPGRGAGAGRGRGPGYGRNRGGGQGAGWGRGLGYGWQGW